MATSFQKGLIRPQSACQVRARPQALRAGPRTALRVQTKAVQDAALNARIQVQGKHMQVTEAINEYATKKVAGAIEPFKQAVRDVDVRLSVRGGDAGRGERQQRMEVTVRTARHGVVRAEVVKDDLYAAIDVACDKVFRNLRKMKEKAVSRGTWAGRGGDKGQDSLSAAAPEEVDASLTAPSDELVQQVTGPLALPTEIKRTKVFYLDEMTVEDALDQLQQVDHDFYIYLDATSGRPQVVYKRHNNDGYGVIITVPDETA